MPTTAVPNVKPLEIKKLRLTESVDIHSITDFHSDELTESEEIQDKIKEDFVNTFICHIIFYLVFSVSAILYILLDLGLSSLIKNQFFKLIELVKRVLFDKKLVIA